MTEPGSMADLAPDADPEQLARTTVLRRLSVTSRTRKELADDLRRRGIPDEVADRVLARFADVGLIDDAEYARSWVDSRQRTKGSARSVLRQELRARGVSDDDASAALENIDEDVERDRALALVTAKVRATGRLDPLARRRRLVNMLVRRGYGHAVALSVVNEALAADEAES